MTSLLAGLNDAVHRDLRRSNQCQSIKQPIRKTTCCTDKPKQRFHYWRGHNERHTPKPSASKASECNLNTSLLGNSDYIGRCPTVTVGNRNPKHAGTTQLLFTFPKTYKREELSQVRLFLAKTSQNFACFLRNSPVLS